MDIDLVKKALILDDDADVRIIMESILTELGYFCINVSDIRSAISIFDCNEISLLLVDISVPADVCNNENLGNGLDFHHYVRKKNFKGKSICVSGFADILIEDPSIKEFDCVLSKPFTKDELVSLIYNEKKEKK
ncbi:MAG: response regulator [Oligoflexia bacterium]|nr:response regulator [Oligoflexia bacterium]